MGGRTAIEAAGRFTLTPRCDLPAVRVIYKAGKNSQTQAQRNAEIIKGTLSACPGTRYYVKAEALRSDMASASEYLASITLDGGKVLPKMGCNPTGSDTACDFANCPVVSGASVTSQTGSIAVGFDVKETSWDCDCDTNTFECSAENKVAGRTAIEAAVRITLDPKCDKIVKVIYKAGKNSQTQAQRNAEIIKGTISVCKGVEYSVKAEALRGDMASASEYLASITLDGAKVLPKAGCNPPGTDLDCDFWNCPVVSGATVTSKKRVGTATATPTRLSVRRRTKWRVARP